MFGIDVRLSQAKTELQCEPFRLHYVTSKTCYVFQTLGYINSIFFSCKDIDLYILTQEGLSGDVSWCYQFPYRSAVTIQQMFVGIFQHCGRGLSFFQFAL